MDRMDQLAAEAIRQGFKVWQTRRGGWVFQKGTIVVTETSTPTTAAQWMRLITTLRGAGLVFPPDEPD